MDFKEIRATFTGQSSKPSYGLPSKPKETTSDTPRGSVKALVQMYENRIRESSQEAERSSVRNSSVGRLSEDKLSPFLTVQRPSEDYQRNRSQSTNPPTWLSSISDSPPVSIKLNKFEPDRPSVKSSPKVFNQEPNKKLATKIDLKLDQLNLEKIEEKSEFIEKNESNKDFTFALTFEDSLDKKVDEKNETRGRKKEKKQNDVQDAGTLNETSKDILKNTPEDLKVKDSKSDAKKVAVKIGKFQDFQVKTDDDQILADKTENHRDSPRFHHQVEDEVKEKNEKFDREESSKIDQPVLDSISEKEKRRLERRRRREIREKEKNDIIEKEMNDLREKEKSELKENSQRVVVTDSNPDFEPFEKISDSALPTNSNIVTQVPEKTSEPKKKRSKKNIKNEENSESFYIIEENPDEQALSISQDVHPELFHPIEPQTEFIKMDLKIQPKVFTENPEDKEEMIVFQDYQDPQIEEIKPKKSKKVKNNKLKQDFFPPEPIEVEKPVIASPKSIPISAETEKNQSKFHNFKSNSPKTHQSNGKLQSSPKSQHSANESELEELVLEAPAIKYQETSSDQLNLEKSLNIEKSLESPLSSYKPADFLHLTSPYNDFSYQKPAAVVSNKPIISESSPKPVTRPPLSFPRIKSPEVTSPEVLISEIDITCINCYEVLNPEDIDSHSLKCLKPNLELNDSMQADLRLRKLLRSISSRKISSIGEKYNLYCLLEEYSLAILEKTMNSYSIEEKLEEIFQNSLKIKEGLPIMVLSKRLSYLLELKGYFSINDNDTDLLKLYQEEAERQKKELEKWKLRSELLLQLAGNPASQGVDVDSDVESGRSSCISYVSGFSDNFNDIGNLDDIEQVLHEISEEELEKHFYGICVRAKLGLPKRHPNSEIPISSLFEEVKKKKVPVSQWKEFVSSRLGLT